MPSLFADPAALAMLAAQLQTRLASPSLPNQLRAWVAGCGTGENAYACAMLLHEVTAQAGLARPIKVFATDADPQQLAAARLGVYPSAQLGPLNSARHQRYWFAAGDYVHARESIRASIVFAVHQLLHDPPFARLDLLICNESFAALEQPAASQLLQHFAFALRPGGLLLLEAALPVESQHFASLGLPRLLYVRRPTPALTPDTMFTDNPPTPSPDGSTKPPSLVKQSSLLIDAQSMILHLYPGAERFLRMGGGTPSYHLLELIHPQLRQALRNTFARAVARQRAAESEPVGLVLDGVALFVTIVVQPLVSERRTADRLLVLFDATAPPLSASVPARERTMMTAAIPDEHLHIVVQHNAAVQELWITNEELMVANEELDVRREELGTLNSELLRINSELNSTIEEISRLNADLENLIAAIDIGTLFLDHELRIRRYTWQVEEIFNLLPADQGRPLAHLTHRLCYDGLLDDLAQLLVLLIPVEREVRHVDGRWFLVRLRPYRTADHRIDGVVLTFLDISERRLVDEALRSSEQQLRQSHEELEQRVQERTADLQEARERLQRVVGAVVQAQEDERGRVARELHDTLGQFLTALTLRLSLLQQTSGIMPTMHDGLADLHRVAAQIDGELDRLTTELRPPALDDLGLEDALHEYTREWSGASGVAVDVLARGLDGERLPMAVEATVYRIVQEALTNVLKHAQASRVSVILERRNGGLRAIVEDNGCGFDPEMLSGQGRGGRQLGLVGMSERAALAGGELSVESAPGAGTTIFVHIPLMQP